MRHIVIFSIVLFFMASCQEEEVQLPSTVEELEVMLNDEEISAEQYHINERLFKAYFNEGDFEQAIGFNQKTTALAAAMESRPLLAKSYFWKGKILTKQHNYLDAIKAYQHAGFTYEQLNDNVWTGWSAMNAGYIFMETNHHNYALQFLNKADSLFEVSNVEGLPTVYYNIGVSYLSLPDPELDKSLSYFNKAIKQNNAAENKNKHIHAGGLNYIGTIYFKKKDFESAIKYYELSLSLSSGDDEAIALMNIGEALTAQGKLKEAKGYLEKSSAFRNEISDRNRLQLDNIQAKYYQAQNDHEQAITTLEKAIVKANRKIINPDLGESAILLEQLYNSTATAGVKYSLITSIQREQNELKDKFRTPLTGDAMMAVYWQEKQLMNSNNKFILILKKYKWLWGTVLALGALLALIFYGYIKKSKVANEALNEIDEENLRREKVKMETEAFKEMMRLKRENYKLPI